MRDGREWGGEKSPNAAAKVLHVCLPFLFPSCCPKHAVDGVDAPIVHRIHLMTSLEE